MIRLIALDLDGTLLSHEGRVGPRNAAALRTAESAGVKVVIATGRRHSYALKVLGELGLRADTLLVSSNGAVVRTFGSELVERMLMAAGTARWLCGVLKEFRNALVMTFDRTGPMGEDECGALVVEELVDLQGSIGKWMEANAPYIQHLVPIERALEGAAPIQMMLCGTVERMQRAEAVMLAYPEVRAVGDGSGGGLIQLNRTEYPERDLSIVDILPAGCSKGAAVMRLADRLGIVAEDVMAIGDNWNDLSMLEVARWPVLMANAPADLLAMAAERGWKIAGDCREEGVADVVLEVLASKAMEQMTAVPN